MAGLDAAAPGEDQIGGYPEKARRNTVDKIAVYDEATVPQQFQVNLAYG